MALDAQRPAALGSRCQPVQRWLAAGCFEALVDDLARGAAPDSGSQAGAKRKRGSKVHMAVDTLGYLLTLHVTTADADDRTEVERLARTVQAITDESIDLVYVDQGSTGERAAGGVDWHGIELDVVKSPSSMRHCSKDRGDQPRATARPRHAASLRVQAALGAARPRAGGACVRVIL